MADERAGEWRELAREASRDHAVRIAGALAELGVATIRFEDALGQRELVARETDLPGAIRASLAAHGRCRLRAGSITIECSRDSTRWRGEDEGAAAAMAARLRA